MCCMYSLLYFVFFFFKQKTAYEMRSSDWSSDVCSSDLLAASCQQSRAQVDAVAQHRKQQDRAALPLAAVSKELSLQRGGQQGKAAGEPGLATGQAEPGKAESPGGGDKGRPAEAGRQDGGSEKRRVGKEGGSTWTARWSAEH